MTQKCVGIVGANGYSGQELCALLARHPYVESMVLTSQQHAGKKVSEVIPRFAKYSKIGHLRFIAPSVSVLLSAGVEIVFLAVPAEVSMEWVPPLLEAGVRVIDISAGFRIHDASKYQEFYGCTHPAPHLLAEAVYGLPEWRRRIDLIRAARLVACPGCYPTSILLPLLPLVAHGLLQPDSFCIASASGVSGAGRTPEVALLFGECHESFRAYGVPKHRHLPEIEQELSFAAGKKIQISFVPHLVPANRGLHSTIFAVPNSQVEVIAQVLEAWKEDYEQSMFVRIHDTLPDTKNVNMTNFCDLAVRLDSRTGKLLLFSAIDNLIKGASGQAIQCFNLMNGFTETEGLM